VLEVRRRIPQSASNASSSSSTSSTSSSSSLVHSIMNLKSSPRRRLQQLSTTGDIDLCRRQQQHPRRPRRVSSGWLSRSSSVVTTDYGWLDAAVPRPHLSVSRSLTDLRPQSSVPRSAADRVGLTNCGQVREALEPIHEAAELTNELNRNNIREKMTMKSEKMTTTQMEINKENVRPPLLCSISSLTVVSEVNKDEDASPQIDSGSALLPPSSSSSLPLNPDMRRVAEVGDGLQKQGDVTSGSASCRKALIPTSCTMSPADDAAAKSAQFRRGLARRSFSLPRVRSKFSLKV